MHRSQRPRAPEALRPAAGHRDRGEGSHRQLFEQACARHCGNPQGQFAWYLAHAAVPAATGRRRQVSDKTRTDYGATLKALPAQLRALRRPLQNASEFGQPHVLALVRHWGEQGHSEGTIQWRVSLLRRFFTLVGRPQALPAGARWRALLRAHGISAGTLGRSHVASSPKGWRDRGIDAEALLDSIRAVHPVVASQLDLCLWFGLRKNEALQIRPAEADQGTHLNVVAGTKGGKPRSVAFSTDADRADRQRQVLERAKQLAAVHPRGILSLPGLSLAQARNHVGYVLRKFGISRKALGVTQHGLRHQFGSDLFASLCGLPAPVLAAAPPAAYDAGRAELLAARRFLSRQMGHERTSITNAYIGSLPALQRDAQQRLQAWLRDCAGLHDLLLPLHVQLAWIVGKCAWGLPLSPGEAIQLCLRVPATTLADADLLPRLQTFCREAGARLGTPVRASLQLDDSRPADGAEIVFRVPAGNGRPDAA